jgi:hypothetical protein
VVTVFFFVGPFTGVSEKTSEFEASSNYRRYPIIPPRIYTDDTQKKLLLTGNHVFLCSSHPNLILPPVDTQIDPSSCCSNQPRSTFVTHKKKLKKSELPMTPRHCFTVLYSVLLLYYWDMSWLGARRSTPFVPDYATTSGCSTRGNVTSLCCHVKKIPSDQFVLSRQKNCVVTSKIPRDQFVLSRQKNCTITFSNHQPQCNVGHVVFRLLWHRLVLSVENDNDFRWRCEWIFRHFGSS